MRTYAQAVAFAEAQRLHPTQSWTYLCQSFSRQCVGASAWAGDALTAWQKIPSTHRFRTTPKPGSLLYFGASHPGHVVFVVGNGYCYSTDVLRQGKIDRVPIAEVQHWLGSSYPTLGWIDWTPSGLINLAPTAPRCSLSKVQAAAKLDPPAAQGHVTYPGDVILVERTLARLGYLDPRWVDGSYGSKTIEGYAKWQRAIRSAVTTGRPTLADLKPLGLKGGFVVVT